MQILSNQRNYRQASLRTIACDGIINLNDGHIMIISGIFHLSKTDPFFVLEDLYRLHVPTSTTSCEEDVIVQSDGHRFLKRVLERPHLSPAGLSHVVNLS